MTLMSYETPQNLKVELCVTVFSLLRPLESDEPRNNPLTGRQARVPLYRTRVCSVKAFPACVASVREMCFLSQLGFDLWWQHSKRVSNTVQWLYVCTLCSPGGVQALIILALALSGHQTAGHEQPIRIGLPQSDRLEHHTCVTLKETQTSADQR